MFIRTERLFLRPGWPEDFDELVEMLGEDPVEGELLPAETLSAIRAYLGRPRDPRLPLFFIYFRAALGPVLVGGLGLAMRETDVELDFFIAPRFRGNGYGAEAVRAVLEQAYVLGHRQLIATSFVEESEAAADSGSAAEVLIRAGFRRTDEMRPRLVPGQGDEMPARLYVADVPGRRFPASATESMIRGHGGSAGLAATH